MHCTRKYTYSRVVPYLCLFRGISKIVQSTIRTSPKNLHIPYTHKLQTISCLPGKFARFCWKRTSRPSCFVSKKTLKVPLGLFRQTVYLEFVKNVYKAKRNSGFPLSPQKGSKCRYSGGQNRSNHNSQDFDFGVTT